MQGAELTQRLAAILSADAAGYSRLMAGDEHATVEALDAARAVFRTHIESNQGRVVDTAGDSVLAIFLTAKGAALAALAIQEDLRSLVADVPEERRLHFRIDVHLGDVIEKGDGTVYGDGVNIAARLQGLVEPGGIAVSESVRNAEVLTLARAALAIDPESVVALAVVAFAQWQHVAFRTARDSLAAFHDGIEAAERSFELAQFNYCYSAKAALLAYCPSGSRWEQAREAAEIAWRVNPQDSRVLTNSGFIIACSGDPEEGIADTRRVCNGRSVQRMPRHGSCRRMSSLLRCWLASEKSGKRRRR